MAWDASKSILYNNLGEPVGGMWDDAAQDYYAILGKAGIGLFTVPLDLDGDQLFTEENPGHVRLTGSIEEHMWLVGDAEPTPIANRAIGLVFDPGTDDVTVKVWTGAAWEVM